ncbi:MAG TPA: ThuA domain-containing protein [Flavitalea sp.]|nr:ThuA domain-containing protein [Flavitalea sp.]
MAFAISLYACKSKRSDKPRILVFSKTSGFRHSSIPAGKAALLKLGQENNFDVDTTENAAYFTEDSLQKYAAVVFLNTTMDVLNNYQEADFERYIQSGGGFVGVHSATDTEYDWGWYGRLVGAYFNGHPQVQEAVIKVVDKNNPATAHLPAEWKRTDEWYNFKKFNKDVKVLLSIDEKSYQGGTMNNDHPMSWYHDYDGGRAFYTELGHTDESYSDPLYLKHLLGGIQYAIGENKKPDYDKATTLRVPDEDRFTKTVLTQGTLFEPTEMTILPNLDILVAQRRGEFMLYKHGDSTVKQVGFLNVYFKTSVAGANSEEGLLGLQADPDFAKNNFVYAFYSPVDTSVNRLSRFVFKNDSLDLKSEKIILQFYEQREICCHTGGSIAFGPDRLLFVSAGDNSTPFNQPNSAFINNGFAPLDQRPGRLQYDARRTAGNTNDLRGKILRIRMNEDGTYSIPDGNLFKPGQEKTKPEIFVMGNRNPYRISVDKKKGYLYWGEVGPDSGVDSMETRGPRGYDEVNQARTAGFYGWPLFVGNNYAYHDYDYNTGKSGPAFDAAKPMNTSANNTGLTELPPARPAFIWYPYAASPDFPQMGTGGRTAMAGPVYYTDMYPKETRLPDYYNNKFFSYEWIRGFFKVITMTPEGDFDKMEPFISSTQLNSPIDVEVGPDGKLYILEYGSGWFSKNADAGISRIDYNSGNRAPKIKDITVNKTSGALPLTVEVKVDASDPETKDLTYRWHIGTETKETRTPSLSHTFTTAGSREIFVEVVDEEKKATKSGSVNVYAGNEAPSVQVNVNGNKTFYFPDVPVSYSVVTTDKEDKQTIDSNLVISTDYQEGFDRAATPQGHVIMTEAMTGKSIVSGLDCKACHKVDVKSVGPAFKDVAAKYASDPNSVAYLVNKIIKGGGGVWGEVAMPAHPSLKIEDAKMIVTYIKSLAATNTRSLPAKGTVVPTMGKPFNQDASFLISASYTDNGGNNIQPLTGFGSYLLRSPSMDFSGITNLKGYTKFEVDDRYVGVIPNEEAYFSIDSIDLSGIKTVEFMYGAQKGPSRGYSLEIRLDKQDGEILGKGSLTSLPDSKKTPSGKSAIKVSPVADGKFHNLYIITKPDNTGSEQAGIVSIRFK